MQAHTKQLNALYSDAEWAQIARSGTRRHNAFVASEQQGAERVDSKAGRGYP